LRCLGGGHLACHDDRAATPAVVERSQIMALTSAIFSTKVLKPIQVVPSLLDSGEGLRVDCDACTVAIWPAMMTVTPPLPSEEATTSNVLRTFD